MAHKFRLLIGPDTQLLRPNLDRTRPHGRCRFGCPDKEYGAAPRHLRPDASARTIVVEDHRGGGAPQLAGRVLHPDRTKSDGGRESVGVIEQLCVTDQGQDYGWMRSHGPRLTGTGDWSQVDRSYLGMACGVGINDPNGALTGANGQRPEIKDDPRQGGRRRGSSCISPGGSG